ncbi:MULTISPECIES: sugar MFS transporter [Methylobacterium]|jgi:FHS family L-fucose permease-like MFS transporter|uniref:FHS family L-fucose permease-like MFS transporter n=1 Tax=Methylobacterium brachiatum TaxID=269660 RepID=A0AAJ1TT75_9HYPH|nr:MULTISPECIES: sugar MFS transporter [Methylobacterium]AYO82225.1 sugar MFS transporter [Methylobacterium brachiatum]EIZ87102.1 glucose/galactose transporter [Methylobacterium sp. GXF4]MCB4801413.1 sugar MFS transporter [Methylobacterium brachiatum]MDF2597581.1 glucose/galactose transporter [Methylobacterium brachiatum]MDH2311214.1 sugar MFS transporter [Methylobacterium brachiatum]
MAGPIASMGAPAAGTATRDQGSYRPALSLLASLFFMWGFITVINNTLLPHLRSVFDLDYTQTTLIESVWFIAYFVASIPAAKLIERIGYQRALVVGLGIMALGTLGMVLASHQVSYAITLTALFVIASGITLLQVAANPYVAVVGPPETAPARLNLVQAFNSFGTTLAPLFGGYLILGRSASGNVAAGATLSPAERLADAQSVQLPYLIVAAILVVLAVVIARFPLPAIGAGGATKRAAKAERAGLSLWRHRNLVFGVPAIFIYLIAEIGVSNLFINFVSQPEIGNLTHTEASRYLFLLWGGMMVGRFVGSYLMQGRSAETVLAGAAIAAFTVMLVATFATGPLAMWALISVGLFHAVMFPTIFTLGIRGLGPLTEEGAGLLIMAIAGGSLVVVQGWAADRFGLQHSFLITAACELYVLFFALWGSRPGRGASDRA